MLDREKFAAWRGYASYKEGNGVASTQLKFKWRPRRDTGIIIINKYYYY